jgi:hypothetical protein
MIHGKELLQIAWVERKRLSQPNEKLASNVFEIAGQGVFLRFSKIECSTVEDCSHEISAGAMPLVKKSSK